MDEKESSGHLDIPSKTFKSILSWAWYELRHWYPFWCFCCAALVSFGLTFKAKSWTGIFSTVVLGYSMIFLAFLSPHIIAWRKSRLLLRHRILFASQVNSVSPGVSNAEWDTVACEMNEVLYRDGIWRTPYALYNGDSCRAYFRTAILEPYYKDKSGDLEKDAARQSASEYEESLRELFDGCCKEEPLEISSEFSQLPRDLFRSRFAFNKGFFKTKTFWLSIAYDLLILGPWQMDSLIYFRVTYLSLLIVVVTFFSYRDFARQKFAKLGLNERTKVLADVLKARPQENCADDWDALAKGANQWLRAQGIWKTSSELFFDGREFKKFYEQINRVFKRVIFVELEPLVEEVKAALADDNL